MPKTHKFEINSLSSILSRPPPPLSKREGEEEGRWIGWKGGVDGAKDVYASSPLQTMCRRTLQILLPSYVALSLITKFRLVYSVQQIQAKART